MYEIASLPKPKNSKQHNPNPKKATTVVWFLVACVCVLVYAGLRYTDVVEVDKNGNWQLTPQRLERKKIINYPLLPENEARPLQQRIARPPGNPYDH